MVYKIEEWVWLGNAGHFICAQWCRFHLATIVGPWLVSTVGEYVHPRHSEGSEQKDSAWWIENWPGEDIGYNRKYETMVFHITSDKKCQVENCGCSTPADVDFSELDVDGYNLRGDAERGHLAMCMKWADIKPEEVPSDAVTH
jgi:hypothetical protein